MLGVFKRRWKPKRVASDSVRPAVPEELSPEPPERPLRQPPTRQIHPLTAEPNQLHAYDATLRRKTKTLKSTEDTNQMNHLANRNVPSSPVYPMTPNICVEGGRIEFVKTASDGGSVAGVGTPPSSPLGARSMRFYEEEKFDGDKEALEERIRQLEQRLEAEALSAQKDRLAVARLQQQLAKRDGSVSRDGERARARGEVHARLARAEHEAERAGTRLRAAHKELARMEETVRSLLQYKSRVDALKLEKSSLSAALEARSIHYQTNLSKLSSENESLKAQVAVLQAETITGEEPPKIQGENPLEGGDTHRRQYERCLDDVANQVVRALLSQKGLREELGRLSGRARDLEAQNRALGALLLRQLRPRAAPSPASPPNAQDINAAINGSCYASTTISTHSSNELTSDSIALSGKRCSRRGRLYKSNDDITTSASMDNDETKKRFSAGNLIIPVYEDRLCCAKSIMSFKDESFGDIMSVCVSSNHAYKLSADDKRRHQILTDLWTELKGIEVTPQSLLQALRAVDPALWAPPERPLTLNLKMTAPNLLSHCLHRLSQTLPDHLPQQSTEDEAAVESPESGNRDEGYSTMSSDVQADPLRQGEPNRELEDLKEASDETDNQVLLNINNAILLEDNTEPDILYIPVNLAVSLNPRNSYPPTKAMFPFQHIMRSFSDSHLCLKLTTGGTPYGENCFSFSSPLSSSPSMLLLDVSSILPREKKDHPLRRTRGTASLISPSTITLETTENVSQSRTSWVSNIDEQVDGCQYDAEYVQHWLQLDDTRSALQQHHRDLLELEYDQAELEDWSLNLSCEDLQDGNWKRSSISDAITPGQISLSTLPSIQENNALELEEDASECLWNNSSYMMDNCSDKFAPLSNEDENLKREGNHWPYPPVGNSGLVSPGGSWSSIDNSEDCCVNNDCFYNTDNLVDNDTSKRSSAALSGCSDEPESSAVGTDFTRDFYRLVKFESTKSLASNSSRGLGAGGGAENSGSILRIPDLQYPLKQDREQALQNVLNFIAEQKKYYHNREELDSLPSRPTSEIRELPPPYIDNQEFNIDENSKRLCETKFSQGSCRNSFGSEMIYSENESCDIILSNDFNSMYSDISPDLKKVPRIIDNQNDEFFSDSDNYLNARDIQNAENEIDEQHLLKVHQKNEINKNIDVNNGGNIACSASTERNVCLTLITPSSPKLSDNSKYTHTNSQYGDRNELTIDQTRVCNGSLLETKVNQNLSSNTAVSTLEASSDSAISASSELECSLLEEVLNACKRSSGSLVTVPEEEEASMDNSLTQTSDSMTTSVSTSDTIATEICNSKRKLIEKSKIPIPASARKSQIPLKSKSRIPIPGLNKSMPKGNDVGECSMKSNGVLQDSIIVSQGPSHSRMVSFHEAATSKDVIDELNRMIRKGEDGVGGSDNEASGVNPSSLDNALWCPTGWVHVEREIDFSDPKARANLLDVMLASSDSSPSPTSSCAGSFSSDSGDDRADYSKLHRLHRYRRQKKAAALKERGLAVLRFSCFHRPSIIGRNDFFVRYGKQERDAVACFDFLEDMSTGANFVPSIEETKSILENQISQDSGKASQRSADLACGRDAPDSDNSSRVTFSDSCAVSFSGSDISFEENTP